MLILSRRLNEKIVIGDNIIVSVVEVRGDQVKLGIDAPRSVKVFREEVFNAIQEENKKAAAASGMQLPEMDIPIRTKS
jgi:carbon storage regulator